MTCWHRILRLGWLAGLVSFSGCLVTHHVTHIVRENEPRREVQFESVQVRQAFDARVADLKDKGDKPRKERYFAIPFLLSWSREDVLADNAWYNDQLAACDTNGDSRITLDEAWVYNPRFREGMKAVAAWNAAQGAAQVGTQTSFEQPLPALAGPEGDRPPGGFVPPEHGDRP